MESRRVFFMAQMLSIPTCEENHTKQSPTFPMLKTLLAWLRLKVFKPSHCCAVWVRKSKNQHKDWQNLGTVSVSGRRFLLFRRSPHPKNQKNHNMNYTNWLARNEYIKYFFSDSGFAAKEQYGWGLSNNLENKLLLILPSTLPLKPAKPVA